MLDSTDSGIWKKNPEAMYNSPPPLRLYFLLLSTLLGIFHPILHCNITIFLSENIYIYAVVFFSAAFPSRKNNGRHTHAQLSVTCSCSCSHDANIASSCAWRVSSRAFDRCLRKIPPFLLLFVSAQLRPFLNKRHGAERGSATRGGIPPACPLRSPTIFSASRAGPAPV